VDPHIYELQMKVCGQLHTLAAISPVAIGWAQSYCGCFEEEKRFPGSFRESNHNSSVIRPVTSVITHYVQRKGGGVRM
jgi:hypothetical protein